ncbi:hypothetical protein Trydic_g6790 [Trypoxylus dichotomus]
MPSALRSVLYDEQLPILEPAIYFSSSSDEKDSYAFVNSPELSTPTCGGSEFVSFCGLTKNLRHANLQKKNRTIFFAIWICLKAKRKYRLQDSDSSSAFFEKTESLVFCND